jgi:molybdopterin-containing oxidoreductase family iron-sulfur binding subunit
MVIDQNRCVGCYACTIACKIENGTPRGIWYAPVYEKEIGHYPVTKRVFLPTLCNHCEDAPCMQACPTEAISRRPDGIIAVNEDKCCGSRACVAACPYGAMHFYDEPGGEFGEELTPLERLFQDKFQRGTAQKVHLLLAPHRRRRARARLRRGLPHFVPHFRRPGRPG